jgi:hypothetical protein
MAMQNRRTQKEHRSDGQQLPLHLRRMYEALGNQGTADTKPQSLGFNPIQVSPGADPCTLAPEQKAK